MISHRLLAFPRGSNQSPYCKVHSFTQCMPCPGGLQETLVRPLQSWGSKPPIASSAIRCLLNSVYQRKRGNISSDDGLVNATYCSLTFIISARFGTLCPTQYMTFGLKFIIYIYLYIFLSIYIYKDICDRVLMVLNKKYLFTHRF